MSVHPCCKRPPPDRMVGELDDSARVSLSDADIAAMTVGERTQLIRRLTAFQGSDRPVPDLGQRRRKRMINVLVVACLGLIPWIVFLALTLPHRYVVDHWPLVWVGLDVAEFVALAVTAWAAWRRRQVVIGTAIVTGTLLVVDAWFDIVTDSTTRDLVVSIVTAALGELPLAALAFVGAFRLIRITSRSARALSGEVDDLPLWRVPLFGVEPFDSESGTAAGRP